MKIALAQQNYHIGNFEKNVQKIIDGIGWAKQQGADLVIFSELCVCGYPPRDFLEFNDFIDKCYESVNIVRQYADTIGVLIGGPARNSQVEGKDLFNAVFLLHEKEIKEEIHKTLLPNYDVFDEYRYFEPAYDWKVMEFKGKKLAVTICEDVWNMGDNPLYRITPMEKLMPFRPDVMINLSASPYNYAQDIVRNSIVKAHVLKYKMPMRYCNTVGSQTEILFDGGSLVYDSSGSKVKEMRYFEEDYEVFDLERLTQVSTAQTVASTRAGQPVLTSPAVNDIPTVVNNDGRPSIVESPQRAKVSAKEDFDGNGSSYYYSAFDVGRDMDTIEYLVGEKNTDEIYHAIILGIRDYFGKMGFSKAILGASGGIDSAVTQVLAVEALGKENVRAILMPSQYSTS